MMISTRGRYALRVMVDLAEHSDDNFIPMKEVAERQHISLKYIEKILPALSKNNLILGVHGKGGGYKLTRKPGDYSVYEILKVTEGEFVPVACLDCNNPEECANRKNCRTKPMWNKLQSIINDYLESVSIEDLLRNKDSELLQE